MTTPLPSLLRRAEDALSGAQAAEVEAETAVPQLLGEIIAHPALAPALVEPPAREPAVPPVDAVVLAKLICEIAHRGKLIYGLDGKRQWNTPCLAVQWLAFIAHGYSLAWYGEPLVDEQFEMFSGGPSLASLRDLDGWKFRAEDSPAVLAADTFPVAPRHRAVVRAIVDGQGIWGMDLDRRVAKFPVVVDGDLSQGAIQAYFQSLISKKERSALSNRPRVPDRADAIESMIDADTRSELLRRWLSEG